jgi:hypothetical protein
MVTKLREPMILKGRRRVRTTLLSLTPKVLSHEFLQLLLFKLLGMLIGSSQTAPR